MKIKINNRLILSDVPEEIHKMIQSRLTFLNPKWKENERMGRWNRGVAKTLKFYEKGKNDSLIVPRGFARQVMLLCRHYGADCTLDDQRRILTEVPFTFSGTLKPFQQKAADKMLSKEFGTLSAPTGSGKTVIALYIISQRKQPAIIVVHTRDLAVQWRDRIETFLNIPVDEIGMIGDGQNRMGNKITVALVQSLYRRIEEAVTHIGFLVVDECHRAPSRMFTEAVSAFDSRYMLGLTATPWRRDQLSELIFWHLGDVHHTIRKDNLVEKGHILDVDVIIRETAFKPYFDPTREYSKMLAELTADDDRNKLIASDVADEIQQKNAVCLILSDRKKHCENLQTLLKFRHKIELGLMTGDLSTRKRQAVLEDLKNGKIKGLAATGQLIGEGFDCKELSTLFIATPIKFKGRLIQYLGRILRPAPGKDRAAVYDYVDVHVGPLVASASIRHQVYASSRRSE